MRVFLEPTGIGKPKRALGELQGLAAGTDIRIVTRDRTALARGTGWVYVDVPAAETAEDALLVVQTILDRGRTAHDAFAVFPAPALVRRFPSTGPNAA